MIDKRERKLAREFKKFVREHPDEAFFVVTAQEFDPEPDFTRLQTALGFSESAYFSICNLNTKQF